MHLRLASLALAILVPASAAVLPVHNLLTDATPESAAAAAMRAYGELAPASAPTTVMRQLFIPSLEPDHSKIEVRNLADGAKGVLLREAMVVASLGKHGSCPQSKKALSAMQTSNLTQRHDDLKTNANGAGRRGG